MGLFLRYNLLPNWQSDLEHKANSPQWGIWKMEESLEELLSLLPDSRRKVCEQELLRFTSEHRKKEWLSVRVLLYTMLQEDKEISYSPEGKPQLADHSYFISISHTKGYIAVILDAASPVGIDIEQYGKRVHRVANRFVRPDELIEPYLEDTAWSLLLHWSAKETIFKRMEHADPDLRKLRLSHFLPQAEGVFVVHEEVTEQQQHFRVSYLICPDFVLTWTNE